MPSSVTAARQPCGGLLDAPSDEVMVTVVGKGAHSRSGLRVHRAKRLDSRDPRARDRLPLTSPARTLLDLAADESDAALEEAVAVARQKCLATANEIRAAIERAPGRKGATRP